MLDDVVAWGYVLGAVDDDAAGVDDVAGAADAIAVEGSVARDPTSLSTTGAFANGSLLFAAL